MEKFFTIGAAVLNVLMMFVSSESLLVPPLSEMLVVYIPNEAHRSSSSQNYSAKLELPEQWKQANAPDYKVNTRSWITDLGFQLKSAAKEMET